LFALAVIFLIYDRKVWEVDGHGVLHPWILKSYIFLSSF